MFPVYIRLHVADHFIFQIKNKSKKTHTQTRKPRGALHENTTTTKKRDKCKCKSVQMNLLMMIYKLNQHHEKLIKYIGLVAVTEKVKVDGD